MQKIFIGSDHGGFELKRRIVQFLRAKGAEVADLGPHEYDKDDDYPDYAWKVCREVLQHGGRGILICRSGNGMARAANKVRGIYAAVCWNEYSAVKEMEHGNTNVLCLSADQTGPEEAERIVDAWLSTPFSGDERHIRRHRKIGQMEKQGL